MKPKPAGEHTWGGRFYRRRTQLGITQHQASAVVGVSQQAISKFETGQVTPRWATLEGYARLCGTTMAELFPMELRPQDPSPSAEKARRDKVQRRHKAGCS